MDILDGMVSAGGNSVGSRLTMTSKSFYWAKRTAREQKSGRKGRKPPKSPQFRDFRAPALAGGSCRNGPQTSSLADPPYDGKVLFA